MSCEKCGNPEATYFTLTGDRVCSQCHALSEIRRGEGLAEGSLIRAGLSSLVLGSLVLLFVVVSVGMLMYGGALGMLKLGTRPLGLLGAAGLVMVSAGGTALARGLGMRRERLARGDASTGWD